MSHLEYSTQLVIAHWVTVVYSCHKQPKLLREGHGNVLILAQNTLIPYCMKNMYGIWTADIIKQFGYDCHHGALQGEILMLEWKVHYSSMAGLISQLWCLGSPAWKRTWGKQLFSSSSSVLGWIEVLTSCSSQLITPLRTLLLSCFWEDKSFRHTKHAVCWGHHLPASWWEEIAQPLGPKFSAKIPCVHSKMPTPQQWWISWGAFF